MAFTQQPLKHNLKVFACKNSRYLGEKIAASLGVELGKSELLQFSDGEFEPSYLESVRGAMVYIVQSTFPPADNLMELLLMIDAAKRASAHKVIAVMPYFGWARQDRKDQPRVPIGAKVVANLLESVGCDRVMTMDLHADQIQGFFDIPVDHLYASTLLIKYIEEHKGTDLAIASPDMGGAKRANAYAKRLDASLIICHKSRAKANVVGSMTAIGDVEGKDVVIVDDMVDTAGTITKCANMLKEKGAKSVRAICTHPVLSGEAYKRIAESAIEQFIITDSIPLKEGVDTSKFVVVTVADLFAEIITKVHNYNSISTSFIC
ncbi:MAG: ribose-phosphate pyrophosphokinase [Bacteroidales bacterium]|nr:ribose-phosphate pyrophosphokinase [Bacteroidales bacterium]